MNDTPLFPSFKDIHLNEKGWSGDMKYRVQTLSGEELLLRIAKSSKYERKRSECEQLGLVGALGVPWADLVDLGFCCGGRKVYQLLIWVYGEDAEQVLPVLTEEEQYDLGVRSGEIVKVIHSVRALGGQEGWALRFSRKTGNKMARHVKCGLRFPGDWHVIEYLRKNYPLLNGGHQFFQHGDYHVGNMIIGPKKAVAIVDWDRFDYGDPREEFNRIVWSATVSPVFASSQLRGYFGG